MRSFFFVVEFFFCVCSPTETRRKKNNVLAVAADRQAVPKKGKDYDGARAKKRNGVYVGMELYILARRD